MACVVVFKYANKTIQSGIILPIVHFRVFTVVSVLIHGSWLVGWLVGWLDRRSSFKIRLIC